jgi:hypothetical protein
MVLNKEKLDVLLGDKEHQKLPRIEIVIVSAQEDHGRDKA